jgi:hypothetical protein
MCDERGKETNSPYGMDKEDRRSWQGDMCVMYQDHCYCHKLYCSYCCISFVDFFYFNYYFIFIKVCWNFKFLKLYFPKIDTILMKSTVLKKNTLKFWHLLFLFCCHCIPHEIKNEKSQWQRKIWTWNVKSYVIGLLQECDWSKRGEEEIWQEVL